MPTWVLANLSKTWGGGEKWNLTAAQALQERGHHVALIVYPQSVLAEKAQQWTIPLLPLRARSISLVNPVKVWRLWLFLKRFRPDAIILNSSHELIFIGCIAKWVRIPQIILRRGIPRPLQGHRLNRWYFRHVLTRVIVNSVATLHAMQSVFAQEMKLLQPAVIYNGVDLRLWQRTQPKEPGQAILAVVGRLAHEKGVDRALQAFADIVRQWPAAQLWIIGAGEERLALENLAKELAVAHSVKFLGFQENVRALLEQVTVLLLTSRWEGFGFVLIEAMSLEVPPVAYAIDAAKEIIIDGETGRLIPDGQTAELVAAVIDLLSDDTKRAQMGQRARLHGEQHFSLERMVEKLENLLPLAEVQQTKNS